MQRPNLTRHLVLNGAVICLLAAVSFYPITAMVGVWEIASVRLHPIATVVRVAYGCAVVTVGIVAWKKNDVKWAMLFLAMLAFAVGFVALVLWRW